MWVPSAAAANVLPSAVVAISQQKRSRKDDADDTVPQCHYSGPGMVLRTKHQPVWVEAKHVDSFFVCSKTPLLMYDPHDSVTMHIRVYHHVSESNVFRCTVASHPLAHCGCR